MESEIWEYPYGKFRLYIDAALRRQMANKRDEFEMLLQVQYGDEKSIDKYRESLKPKR